MNIPSNYEANLRAIAEMPLDKLAQASEYYRAALGRRPNDAEANFLYGAVLQRQGTSKEARAKLVNAVTLAPKHLGYRVALADFYALQKMWDNAIGELRIATSLAPGDSRVWEKLGDVAGSADRAATALAAFQRARELNPQNIALAMKIAMAASCLKRFDEARKTLEGVAQSTTVTAAFTALYADVLEAQGDWATLGAVAKLWSEQQPNHPRAWEALAKATLESGWLHAAIDFYRRSMALVAPNADRLANFAQLCMNALEFDQAEQALRQAEELDANNVKVLSAKAGLLMFLGRLDEAEAYCRRCLDQDAKNVLAYRLLSQLKRGHLAADERRVVSDLANDTAQNIGQRISAAFVLGNSFDAEEDTTAAMAAYGHAHQMATERGRFESLSYDPLTRVGEVDRLIARFASIPASHAEIGGVCPIFIVGMPRSGTTLIESILGSHSRVMPCGERVTMRQIMRDYSAASGSATQVAAELLAQLARAYFAGLPNLNGADHITDKNPWNFDAIGLILTLLPTARIVHVRRNPIETGLSIYRNEFPKYQSFAHRLDHVGHYYGQYARLMAHWESIASNRIVSIQYEKFVADYECSAPALLESCGLEWEEACRNFQVNRRIIPTLSAVQARKPVVDQSGRAQRYEHHLSPLIDALRAAAVDLQTGSLISASA